MGQISLPNHEFLRDFKGYLYFPILIRKNSTDRLLNTDYQRVRCRIWKCGGFLAICTRPYYCGSGYWALNVDRYIPRSRPGHIWGHSWWRIEFNYCSANINLRAWSCERNPVYDCLANIHVGVSPLLQKPVWTMFSKHAVGGTYTETTNPPPPSWS